VESTVHASRTRPTEDHGSRTKVLKKGSRFDGATQIRAGSYFSPGRHHKLQVDATDTRQIQDAVSAGAVELADYGSFKIFEMDERAVAVAAQSARTGDSSERIPASLRDDLNVLLLRVATIDTTSDDAPGTFVTDSASLSETGATGKSRFQL